MGKIGDIVTELETIADAFDSLNSKKFEEPAFVNTAPDRNYPFLLINAINIDVNYTSINDLNFLPKDGEYTIRLQFLDTYVTSERETTDIKTKYDTLEVIMLQYMAEVERRCREESKNFMIQSYTSFPAKNVFNDDLVMWAVEAVFKHDKNTCTTGNFSY